MSISVSYSSDCSSGSNQQKTEYIEALFQMENKKKIKKDDKKPWSPGNDQSLKTHLTSQIISPIETEILPFYPSLIVQNKEFEELFTKQFRDIIGKKLKKKLEKVQNLS